MKILTDEKILKKLKSYQDGFCISDLYKYLGAKQDDLGEKNTVESILGHLEAEGYVAKKVYSSETGEMQYSILPAALNYIAEKRDQRVNQRLTIIIALAGLAIAVISLALR